MRKILFVLSVVLAVAGIKAEAVDKEAARDIARHILPLQDETESVAVREMAGGYVVTCPGGEGFVLVAGDDSRSTVLGYSLTETIDPDNIPPMLERLMQNAQSIAPEAPAQGPLTPGEIIVQPYISAQWNQFAPYNWLTPKVNDKHTPTGCVPTAAAQVMNYYQWPPCSYYREYDWETMADTYIKNEYTEAQGMAVATLMRDLGVILGTTYASGGSSTSLGNYDLIPGYKCEDLSSKQDCRTYVERGPILVCAEPISNASHAAIFDGLDSNGYFHINWGWGGSWNGFYNVDNINIEFNDREQYPGFDYYSTFFIEPDNNWSKAVLHASRGVTTNVSTATEGDEVTVTLHGLQKLFGKASKVYVGLKIYKAPKEEGGYYAKGNDCNLSYSDGTTAQKVISKFQWQVADSPEDITLSFNMGHLAADGDYFLVPVSSPTSSQYDFKPILWRPDSNVNSDIAFTYKNRVATFQTTAQPVKGDLNGDGQVNTGDVSELYMALLAGSDGSRYDLNGDGAVNAGDVSTLYQIILG